ncbi:MAG: chromatin protein Cren7 [Desulfurococcaceae archaeon]
MTSKNAKKCPKCGSLDIEVSRTWNLVSPLPDKAGRITVTVMGVFKCRNCGYGWKGTVSKIKVGGGVEIEGKQEILDERPPKEIVLDLDEILKEE